MDIIHEKGWEEYDRALKTYESKMKSAPARPVHKYSRGDKAIMYLMKTGKYRGSIVTVLGEIVSNPQHNASLTLSRSCNVNRVSAKYSAL